MKKVFFLGQAPPRIPADKPFGRTALYAWLAGVGIIEKHAKYFSFGALIPTYPGSKNGSHLKPTAQQITDARPDLLADLEKHEIEILVPIGILAIREVLCNPTLTLEETIGAVFYTKPFGAFSREVTIIPFPHPSGASPWVHLGDHKILLQKALQELRVSLSL